VAFKKNPFKFNALDELQMEEIRERYLEEDLKESDPFCIKD